MKRKRHWSLRLLKGLFLFSLFVLRVVAALIDEKPTKTRYSAAHAADLYDEGLIGEDEYARSVFGDK